MGLDFQGAGAMLGTEIYGDWYRDPWSWPEIKWGAREGGKALALDLLVSRNGRTVAPRASPFFHLITVPKSQLGSRPAVVIDPATRLLYLASTSVLLKRMHAQLPPWVFGWRVRGDQSTLANNGVEWQSYLAALEVPAAEQPALQTDITSFFASVNVDPAMEALYQRLGSAVPADLIGAVLRTHDHLPSRSGLPQRSFASAAMANFVLEPLDDMLSEYARVAEGASVVRWMDDIYVFGDQEARLYSTFVDLQQRLRSMGMEVNTAKTRLCMAGEVVDRSELAKISNIKTERVVVNKYTGESRVDVDLGPLLAAEEELLSLEGELPRSLTIAVLKGLRQHKSFTHLQEWLPKAIRQPQLADQFGRYLRASEEEDLFAEVFGWTVSHDWIDGALNSNWAALDWAAAQWAFAVPVDRVESALMVRLQAWLESSTSVQQVALAAHRMWVRDAGVYREMARQRLLHEADPLIVRVLALGMLTVGVSRHEVRSYLDSDERHLLTLAYLEAHDWRAPAVAADFDSGTD